MPTHPMPHYDCIIVGGGMAGLSLAYYLSQSAWRNRRVLILDKQPKNTNDRTWCFWEKETGPFESVIFRQWQQAAFISPTHTEPIGMGAYRYNMIRSLDFYRFIDAALAHCPTFERRIATVQRIADGSAGAQVLADGIWYAADWVFDSTAQTPTPTGMPAAQTQTSTPYHYLLQHFKGWIIETQTDCFDPGQAVLMDFRLPAEADCRFVYVLPFSARKALVEFTLFNETLLPENAYDEALRHYLDRYVHTGGYRIIETETGIIPMTDAPFAEQPSAHVVRIGTAGGYTKPSTGYTFRRTQQRLPQLVTSLLETGQPIRREATLKRRFGWYDAVFLNVLAQRRYPADELFRRIYVRNPERVFRFLDEETSIADEIRLFSTMPTVPFLRAAAAVAGRHLFMPQILR